MTATTRGPAPRRRGRANILELLSASLRLAGFEVATATGRPRPSRPCSATGPT